MARIKYDINLIKYISLFESITQVKVKDCISNADMRGSRRDSLAMSKPRGSRQKVKEYVGRVYRFNLMNNVNFLEYFKNIGAKEKILVFDEAWSFLKDHADYIDECFRTFRKTGALPIAISQGLNDFAGSGGKLYSSITNNSFIKVFFPQEKIDDPEVTEFDHEMIKTLHFEKGSFSECYLKSADNKIRKVLRIYLSPLELELFHTEAGEDSKFFDFFNKHRPFLDSNQEAINAYVRLKHANF